jgi:predicted ATPase
MLVVVTFRPEFSPPWRASSHLTLLTLTRLLQRSVEDMIRQVAKRKTLPTEVIQQIVTKTDGVPLFVEELTKMVIESGLLEEHKDAYTLRGSLPPLAIPATLYDSLMARLDRLSSVKEIAQLGAVIGREFSYEALRAVCPLEEDTLQQEVARLVEAELLYQNGIPPQATYMFKHALIREAAYQSLLKRCANISSQHRPRFLCAVSRAADLHPEILLITIQRRGYPKKQFNTGSTPVSTPLSVQPTRRHHISRGR